MIFLTSTSDKIQLITSAAVAVDVHASWADKGAGITPGRTNTAISTATTTDVVGAPASSTQRNVKSITVRNTDAASSVTVTVQHTDGTTTVTLFKCTLAAGDHLQFVDGDGFTVLDSNGAEKQTAAGTGVYLGTTVLTSGTSFTTGKRTNTISARLVGGGGSGGGIVTATTASGGGGGGGSGGYAEKIFAVAPNTAYTYAVGQGGAASSAGGNGNNGTDSTFAVGGTTVTAKGGLAGVGATAVNGVSLNLGGAGGTVSTNGDLNSAGEPGNNGIGVSNALAAAGAGGSGNMGGGGASRKTQGAGLAGAGYGAGSGGACCISAGGTVNSVAGQNGVVVVDEYT